MKTLVKVRVLVALLLSCKVVHGGRGSQSCASTVSFWSLYSFKCDACILNCVIWSGLHNP